MLPTRSLRKVVMVQEQEQERVVVVGSGPAGAARAVKLAELRLPVTMLESGESMPRDFLLRARGRTVFRHRSKRVVRRTAIVAPPGTGWLTALEPGGLSNQWTGA